MWICRRTEKINRLVRLTNGEVIRRVNDDRQILSSTWQRKHQWIGHVLRHSGLLHETFEGMMKGKPTGRIGRIEVLQDLANYDGYVAAKDVDGRRHREKLSNTSSTTEDH